MFTRRGRMPSFTWRAQVVFILWLLSSLWLWTWWFNPGHIVNLGLFIALSIALLYENLLAPLVFVFFVVKAKYPAKRKPMAGKKVALITLCVPSSESMQIIERQLVAMKNVEYPHDSWILDEGNNAVIRKLAKKHRVKYFSRKGVAKYNLSVEPFIAKTKAGNVNAWLDATKKYKYEFFVQFDIDHLPKPNYLHKTLGHFRDKSVGWVQAPSVNNNLTYWTARGSAEQEIGLQGPMQMGFFGFTKAPVITGSHATFRMKAINSINGFQATRAEDHLNTLAMMAQGWNGVYIPEIIAEGNGPETLEAYLTQQFAWSRSMTVVLLRHSYQFMKHLSIKRRLQFGFMQTWYPLWSLSYLLIFITPVIALLTNSPPVTTDSADFWSHTPLLVISSFSAYIIGKPLMQPSKVSLTWRGILLHLIRWPAVLQGILSGIRGGSKPYQVTPKGKFLDAIPSVQLYRTFLALSGLSSIAVFYSTIAYGYRASNAQFLFAFFNIIVMLSICLFDLNSRLRNMRLSVGQLNIFRYKLWLPAIGAVSLATIFASFAVISPFMPDQTTLALSAISRIESHGNIAKLSPQQLTDDELSTEIANPMYKRSTSLVEPTLGIHDTSPAYKTKQPYIRHTFIDWRDARRLKEELLVSQRIGATSLVTIEPKSNDDGAELLKDIAAGKYDSRLQNLAAIMQSSNNNVYVRFAHEMDLPNTYVWGGQDPELYIAAYRHFVSITKRQQSNNLQWVWSPAGTNIADSYYPGDAYTDVVGTTILSVPSWFNNTQLDFATLQSYRANLHIYGKPVWITEFGVENNDLQYQTRTVKQAVDEFATYGYAALIYINIPDSNTSGRDYRLANLNILSDGFEPADALHKAPTDNTRRARITPTSNSSDSSKVMSIISRDSSGH